ncbi:MAG: response regulator [Pseudomonadota bacterium]
MPKKILVIDDDQKVVEYLDILFKDNGYETCLAYDGLQGLELAKTAKPDLITLDMDMPERDGTRFYAKLRKEDDLRDIPVIVISGVGSRPPALKKDMVVISKPFDRGRLLAIVKATIGE